MNAQTQYILKHGKPVFETWEPDPENCVPYDGVEYLGHRLGQVWADSRTPDQPPYRAGTLVEDKP